MYNVRNNEEKVIKGDGKAGNEENQRSSFSIGTVAM